MAYVAVRYNAVFGCPEAFELNGAFGFRRVCLLATGVSFERECVLPFLDEDLPPEDSFVLIFLLTAWPQLLPSHAAHTRLFCSRFFDFP